ncbi:MAG: hypothetical protein ACKOPB_06510, partial [Actinomycetota bacterium]
MLLLAVTAGMASSAFASDAAAGGHFHRRAVTDSCRVGASDVLNVVLLVDQSSSLYDTTGDDTVLRQLGEGLSRVSARLDDAVTKDGVGVNLALVTFSTDAEE